MKLYGKWVGFGLALAGAFTCGLLAQAQRTIVHKGDMSIPGYEANIARVEIAPGAAAGRHTHPGEEITYVLEGEGEILREGQPVQKIKAGDGFIILAGTRHDARNTGSQPMKLIAVYVVKKGEPLATPAP